MNSRDYSVQTQSPSEAANSTQNMSPTSSSSLLSSSSSTPDTMDNEAEPARFVGSAQGYFGGMRILFFVFGQIYIYTVQKSKILQVKSTKYKTWLTDSKCVDVIFVLFDSCLFPFVFSCSSKGDTYHLNLCPSPYRSNHPCIHKNVSGFPYEYSDV